MNDHAIQLRGVWRWFGASEVLRGLSMHVDPGEVYALLGRNGAGKTTALRILLGMLEPHAGSASVLGVDSTAISPSDRGRIGYVGEDHRLYGTMRVCDAVRFEAQTRPGFRTDVAERAIQRCGLSSSAYVMRLSRGQRAQLALILAVGADPEVLIFDDPALGLDAVMRRELLDAMIDLLADTGCAVLFSSHHLQDVERIADRIGILHDGHLLVDAPLDEIKQRVVRRGLISQDATALRERQDWPEAVITCRPRRDGVDLTLLDGSDDALAAELESSTGATLTPPSTPSLEDLFLDLTADERRNIFADAASDTQESA